MKKIIFSIFLITLFSPYALTMEKKINEPSTPMQKIAMVEFVILPPSNNFGNIMLSPLAASINGQYTFKFYKLNSALYNELLGEKLSRETSLNLLYGEKLYNSPEYIDLRNQNIIFYEIPEEYNIYTPSNCYNFIDFEKYKNLSKLSKSKYQDEQENICEICKALKVDGVIFCYFYMNGQDTMFLQMVVFDTNGILIKKLFENRGNMFLTKKNFNNSYLKLVDRVVADINKK